LDATPPHFAHVPLIVGPGGKKLSKRHGPVSVQSYRDEGYLAAALRNWLIRIGWSHGDQEIFSAAQICELFDLNAVNRSAAQADGDKLLWLNQHYIKGLTTTELIAALLPFLTEEATGSVKDEPALEKLVELQRERGKTLVEMARLSRWFVAEAIERDPKATSKHLSPAIAPALTELRDRLAAIDGWSGASIEAAFQTVLDQHEGLKIGKLAQPVRVAVTGGTVSPGIFDTLEVLGQKRTLERIGEALLLVPPA
jgi:glutamyl-tRNA synthetase